MPDASLFLRRDVLDAWLRVSGYTQAKLARATKISEGRISQLLRSEHEEPSPRLMAALLRVTNLSFEQLFSLRPGGRLMQRRMRRWQPLRRPRPGRRSAHAPWASRRGR